MLKHLPELVKENLITQETADNITNYYNLQKKQGQGKALLIFSILGALLVGLGMILILAHNWDELPRMVKTSFAFLPLIIGQLFCVYTILKQSNSSAWREGSATFLFLAIGSSISLISQIYHINGDLSDFLLVWMILALPIVYLLNSSFASLLFIIGSTAYGLSEGFPFVRYYNFDVKTFPYYYLVLILLSIPFYINLLKKQSLSNFIIFHNLVFATSFMIMLEKVNSNYELKGLIHIAFICLFSIYLLSKHFPFFINKNTNDKNLYYVGLIGIIWYIFISSFKDFWTEHLIKVDKLSSIFYSQEMFVVVFLSLSALFLVYKKVKIEGLRNLKALEVMFLIYILIFCIGYNSSELGFILINVTILSLGILTILDGIKSDHLGIVNTGLFIIILLMIIRFFDTDITFLIRGLIFISVGIGFFLTNYRILKARKLNEIK